MNPTSNTHPTIQQIKEAFSKSSSPSTKECLNLAFNWCTKKQNETEEPIDVFFKDLSTTFNLLNEEHPQTSASQTEEIENLKKRNAVYEAEIKSNNEAMLEKDKWIRAARKQLGVLNSILESFKTSQAIQGYEELQNILENVPRSIPSGKPPMKRRSQRHVPSEERKKEDKEEKGSKDELEPEDKLSVKKSKVEFTKKVETVLIDDEDSDRDNDSDPYENESESGGGTSNNEDSEAREELVSKYPQFKEQDLDEFFKDLYGKDIKTPHPFKKKEKGLVDRDYWIDLGGKLGLTDKQISHLREKFDLTSKNPAYKISEFDPVNRRFKIVFCEMEHEKSSFIDKLKYLNILQACMVFNNNIRFHVIEMARKVVDKIYQGKKKVRTGIKKVELRKLRYFFDRIVEYREVEDNA